MSLCFLICKMGDNKSHGFVDLLERVKEKMCMSSILQTSSIVEIVLFS